MSNPWVLNERQSFQAGFLDGLEAKERKTPDIYGYIETDFGSIPTWNVEYYNKGIAMGTCLRGVAERE